MRIFVTGAAGYIGSVVTERLLEQGHSIVAFDNLSRGHRDAVAAGAEFVEGDLLDRARLESELRRGRFDAVVHLAAEALIGMSISDPGMFFRTNVVGGLNLLDAMVQAGVGRIVFSSTCAVYGEPRVVPIDEEAPTSPVNAYGESKLAFEKALGWYARAHGVRHLSLRYFNACGATEMSGERHDPETHLIPILLDVALGHRASVHLFGTDYDTQDGTCVRDYIHVQDIADAHVLCLDRLDTLSAAVFNLGNGTGYSNRQVIDTVKAVTGRQIPVVEAARRPGDPARLVASAERIRGAIGWMPRIPELAAMVDSAWRWRTRQP
jgi:UDP-glucose 4-epimerase